MINSVANALKSVWRIDLVQINSD
ncbi:hypothetical protein EMIT0373P_20207 [Pseudomonas chlororaphis]